MRKKVILRGVGVLAIIAVFFALSCEMPVRPGVNNNIAFTGLMADGSVNLTTSKLTLIFDKDIDNLTVADITLSAGNTGAIKDTLTRTGWGGYYELAVIGITAGGTVSVSVTKSGYTITGGPKEVSVYYRVPPAGDTAIFTGLTANGTSTLTTTTLTLTFDQDITGLMAADITLNAGSTGAGKGALIRTGWGTYELAVIGITAGGTVSVSVTKSGYTITGGPKEVGVYYYSSSNNNTGGEIPVELVAKWYTSQALADAGTGTATIEFTEEGKLLYMGIDNQVTVTVENNIISNYRSGTKVGTVTYSISGTAINFSESTGEQILPTSLTFYKKASINQIPVAGDFNIGNLTQTAGNVTAVTITPKAGKSNGTITIYYNGSTTLPTTAGTYTVTFNVAVAAGWNAASGLSAGTLMINAVNQTPVADDFEITGTGLYTYNGYEKSVSISPKSGKSNGTITIYYNDLTTLPTAVGTYTVTFNVAATTGWNAVSELSAGTLTITKAVGVTVSAPTVASSAYNGITVNVVTASTGQSVEYAISTASDGTGLSAWQSGTAFTGLNANTTYYVYARSIENQNYNTGMTSVSAAITTPQSGTAEIIAYYWVNERNRQNNHFYQPITMRSKLIFKIKDWRAE